MIITSDTKNPYCFDIEIIKTILEPRVDYTIMAIVRDYDNISVLICYNVNIGQTTGKGMSINHIVEIKLSYYDMMIRKEKIKKLLKWK